LPTELPKTMKAIVKANPAPGLEIQDWPVPKIGANDALIRVTAAGICGTDVHILEWDSWARGRIKPPLVVGHEFVGTVAAVGHNVRHIRIGDRVSGEGHLVCGHCQYCRTGQGHICQTVQIIGVDIAGCFAEYLRMPAENLWPVPDSIPDPYAAVFDPLGNAMHTVMAAPVSGKTVLITGAGPIGLFAVAIAKVAGAVDVAVIEPNPFRRGLATKAGADLVLDPDDDDAETALLARTADMGPEVVLEMSGHPGAMRQAFRLVRNGGEVALLGIPREPVAVDWATDIIFKGITIHAVNGRRMYDTWYQCQAFLGRNPKMIEPIITHIVPMEDFQRGLDLIRDGKAGKIVMTIGERETAPGRGE